MTLHNPAHTHAYLAPSVLGRRIPITLRNLPAPHHPSSPFRVLQRYSKSSFNGSTPSIKFGIEVRIELIAHSKFSQLASRLRYSQIGKTLHGFGIMPHSHAAQAVAHTAGLDSPGWVSTRAECSQNPSLITIPPNCISFYVVLPIGHTHHCFYPLRRRAKQGYHRC